MSIDPISTSVGRFGAIVLCGGRSRRMGVAKAMLPFGDEVMLSRVVRIVLDLVDDVVVVAAPQQELPTLDARVVVVCDDVEGRGPLNGIAAGLEALVERCDAAYATSCDVPLLRPEFVRAMFASLGEHDVAVPVEGEFHHPLAAVYRVTAWSLARRLLAENELRPRRLFEHLATRRIPVEQLRNVDPNLDSLMNLNAPADYRAALCKAKLPLPSELPANFYE